MPVGRGTGWICTCRPNAHESVPVVVFFYGGAFRAGRKSEYRFVGEALASRGIIVAVPDYRIYPAARFPDFLNDGAAALVKAREVTAAHGGNPERLFVAGHSAGAYIAVMLAATVASIHEAYESALEVAFYAIAAFFLLEYVLRLYTVGSFLNAWRNPKNHRSIEQVFDSPHRGG